MIGYELSVYNIRRNYRVPDVPPLDGYFRCIIKSIFNNEEGNEIIQ